MILTRLIIILPKIVFKFLLLNEKWFLFNMSDWVYTLLIQSNPLFSESD